MSFELQQKQRPGRQLPQPPVSLVKSIDFSLEPPDLLRPTIIQSGIKGLAIDGRPDTQEHRVSSVARFEDPVERCLGSPAELSESAAKYRVANRLLRSNCP